MRALKKEKMEMKRGKYVAAWSDCHSRRKCIAYRQFAYDVRVFLLRGVCFKSGTKCDGCYF